MKRDYHPSYIMVDEDGMICNIAVGDNYEDMNRIARAVYGNNAFAIEYRYAVSIGDKCRNNIFYNVDENGNETLAEYLPSDEESITALQAENKRLKYESNELMLALAEMIGGDTYAK